MRRLAWLLGPLVLTATACADTPAAPRGIVGGLQILTSVDRARVRPGDTVQLRVVARNVSDTAVTLGSAGALCALTVEVRGPGPVNYYRGARLCGEPPVVPLPTLPLRLAPGDSLVGTAPWPGITYVAPSGSAPGTEGSAPVGTYHAVGFVWTGRRSWLVGDSARIIVAAP